MRFLPREPSHRTGTHRRLTTAIVLGLLTALALPHGASAAEPGLVGQWHLDEVAGSGVTATTPDSSGAGGTGRFADTLTLVPGRFASAFNGPFAAQPMTVSGTSGNGSWGLEPAGAVSLTAWVEGHGQPRGPEVPRLQGRLPLRPGAASDCAGGSYALYTGYNGRPGLTFYVTTADGNNRASPNITDNAKVFDGQLARGHGHLRRSGRAALRRRRAGARRPVRNRLRRDPVRRKPPAAPRVRRRRLPGRGQCAWTTRSSRARSTRSASTTGRWRPRTRPSSMTPARRRRPT